MGLESVAVAVYIHIHHLSSDSSGLGYYSESCYVTRTLSRINKVLIINIVRRSLGIICKLHSYINISLLSDAEHQHPPSLVLETFVNQHNCSNG